MASVAFLRAVNVGGHNVLRPAALAKELADLDVKNIGAAGTYVVRSGASAAAVRKAILAKLDVAPEIMVRPGRDVLALADADPFAKARGKPMVTVLAEAPRKPVDVAAPGLAFIGTRGAFALTCVLPDAKNGLDVNRVVEKAFATRGTTRGWPTILKVADALRDA